jgi:hypothetical protein
MEPPQIKPVTKRRRWRWIAVVVIAAVAILGIVGQRFVLSANTFPVQVGDTREQVMAALNARGIWRSGNFMSKKITCSVGTPLNRALGRVAYCLGIQSLTAPGNRLIWLTFDDSDRVETIKFGRAEPGNVTW